MHKNIAARGLSIALVSSFSWTAAANEPRPSKQRGRAPRLVVTEIFADPELWTDRASEFLELAVLQGPPVAVGALRVRLPTGKLVKLQGGASELLRVGEVAVVMSSRAACGLTAPRARCLVASSMALPNRAGRIEVFIGNERVDVAQWWPRWPWPKHRPGVSLARSWPLKAGERGRAWRHCRSPIRGVERASPGKVPWLKLACSQVARRRSQSPGQRPQ